MEWKYIDKYPTYDRFYRIRTYVVEFMVDNLEFKGEYVESGYCVSIYAKQNSNWGKLVTKVMLPVRPFCCGGSSVVCSIRDALKTDDKWKDFILEHLAK